MIPALIAAVAVLALWVLHLQARINRARRCDRYCLQAIDCLTISQMELLKTICGLTPTQRKDVEDLQARAEWRIREAEKELCPKKS